MSTFCDFSNPIYFECFNAFFFFIGQVWEDKILKVREKMKSKNCGAFVVTPLDELACKL
jgi:hypothetical protein